MSIKPLLKGSGMEDSLVGAVTCSECNGQCFVRIRDDKGRFATREDTDNE